MQLEFYGAADTVSGSLHRVRTPSGDILLECGLFQGRRADARTRNENLPPWAIAAECLVLSHAHIDHSGNIPTLVKRGFDGNIYATPATRDLCSVMLRDAAMIQEQDARYINRRNERDGIDERVEPLYTVQDAEAAVARIISVPLRRTIPIADGAQLTFHEAGHVLGSALVQLDLTSEGRRRRLLFTGDLGRAELPLLNRPDVVPDVNVLVTEGTYGNRNHPAFESTDQQLAEIIDATAKRGGRVFVPSFSLERAQEVLYALERLSEQGRIPPIPIYMDSPLAISITEIYKLHSESLAPDVRSRILSRNDPFSPPGLSYVSEVEDSKQVQDTPGSCVVIAGSGMCEGGRIVHHLRKGLEDQRNSVVIVGFMAQHTLGRRLVEGRRQVRVFGVPRDVHARVHVINGLSAHADRDDLLGFAEAIREAGDLRRVAVVHGEAAARDALAEGIRALGVGEVSCPAPGDQIEL